METRLSKPSVCGVLIHLLALGAFWSDYLYLLGGKYEVS